MTTLPLVLLDVQMVLLEHNNKEGDKEMNLKEFVIKYSNIIDENDFIKLFKSASTNLSEQDIRKLTNMLIDCGVDVTTGLQQKVPKNFLKGTNIKTVTIPEGVISIGACAFDNCRELVSISLPSSLQHCYLGAFENCLSLTDIYFDGTLEDWCKINFTYSSAHPLRNVSAGYRTANLYINKSLVSGVLMIPSSIERVKKYTFQNFDISEIVIPSNISMIEEYAFSGVKPKKVEIKNSSLIMANGCFYNAGNLDISFNGTKEDWKQIYNPRSFENTYFTVNCTDGKIVKKKK